MAGRKKKKPKKEVTWLDICQSVRGSWYGVNPVTKVVVSKKYKSKPKHKLKELNNAID